MKFFSVALLLATTAVSGVCAISKDKLKEIDAMGPLSLQDLLKQAPAPTHGHWELGVYDNDGKHHRLLAYGEDSKATSFLRNVDDNGVIKLNRVADGRKDKSLKACGDHTVCQGRTYGPNVSAWRSSNAGEEKESPC
ncbi:hypothetical protein F5B20DRAFT_557236 [Whalleya microplaca]|nr:hypothetical protein F5B20DRAFT_557236 [Whalleya microplaca]